jgi:DNA-binding response OmpR family regulator
MLPLCLIVAAGHEAPPTLSHEFDGLGFKPYTVQSLASALGLIGQWEFDAVLVDADGRADSLMQTLPELRDRSKAPIVLLSSDGGERRQIQALQGGATEVIVKPASAQLIAAKLHRLVDIARDKRAAAGGEDARSALRLGPLRLDPRRASAAVGETPLQLTSGEFELLLLLASQSGEFVHRDTIARTLGSSGEGRRSADMHICRIRKKLRDAGAQSLRVDTVYGRGYCLRLDPEVAEELFAARHPQWCA